MAKNACEGQYSLTSKGGSSKGTHTSIRVFIMRIFLMMTRALCKAGILAGEFAV